MVLSGASIQKLLNEGILKITPEVVIKEASVKIHLSNKFSKDLQQFIEQEKYSLKPKEFILAKSKEEFEMPDDLAGLYDGYTHLGRKGVITHMGSMFVDPGTKGCITLEIFNASDQEVILESNMRVGHLIFLQVC